MALNLRKVGQVAKGLSQGLMNYRNISLANEKLSRDREDYETNKKISNLKLKTLERDASPEQYAMEKRKQKLALDTAELGFDSAQQKVDKGIRDAEVDVKKKLFLKNAYDKEIQRQQEGIKFGNINQQEYEQERRLDPFTGKYETPANAEARKKQQTQEKLKGYDPNKTDIKDVDRLIQEDPSQEATIEEYFNVKGRKRDTESFGLSPQQELEATNLVSQAGIKRPAEVVKTAIKATKKMMASGMSADDIQDALRKSTQTAGFEGVYRNILQQIGSGYNDRKFNSVEDRLGDLIEKGYTGRIKSFFKKEALSNLGVSEAQVVRGKERTVEFLGEIKSDLASLEAQGVDTGIFTGTKEEVARKVKRVSNPDVRRIATKITTLLQQYRKTMTGVAFSPQEALDYAKIFPSVGYTKDFNLATIQALTETFNGDIDRIYSHLMGEEDYRDLYKQGKGQQFSTAKEARSAGLPAGTIIIINGQEVEVD